MDESELKFDEIIFFWQNSYIDNFYLIKSNKIRLFIDYYGKITKVMCISIWIDGCYWKSYLIIIKGFSSISFNIIAMG